MMDGEHTSASSRTLTFKPISGRSFAQFVGIPFRQIVRFLRFIKGPA